MTTKKLTKQLYSWFVWARNHSNEILFGEIILASKTMDTSNGTSYSTKFITWFLLWSMYRTFHWNNHGRLTLITRS